MNIKTPVIFDTDCISSFSWIKRLDILETLFPKQIIIPQTVYDELNKMRRYSRYSFVVEDIDLKISSGDIRLDDIVFPSEAGNQYLRLISPNNIKQIGKGEAAAIVLANLHQGTLASNNLSDVLPHIASGQPPYISTDTILYVYYKQGYIDASQGQQIWDDMKSKKRALPNYDFNEVIKKFEGVH